MWYVEILKNRGNVGGRTFRDALVTIQLVFTNRLIVLFECR